MFTCKPSSTARLPARPKSAQSRDAALAPALCRPPFRPYFLKDSEIVQEFASTSCWHRLRSAVAVVALVSLTTPLTTRLLFTVRGGKVLR